MVHKAIIVTGHVGKELDAAAQTAITLGLQVIGPSRTSANGMRTICICPDGSEPGSMEQYLESNQRGQFLAWMATKTVASNFQLAYVEIDYGKQ
jgi:hypothetical protein